jgi:acyl-CoA thioesterase
METPRTDATMGPLATLLGIRRTNIGGGRAVFELSVGENHLNPYGSVHGGVIYTLVDYAMGGAVVSRLVPGERCATLEIKINYVAAVSDGALKAEARVVERSSRIAVLEATVHADGDRLVAIATGSFFISPPAPGPSAP